MTTTRQQLETLLSESEGETVDALRVAAINKATRTLLDGFTAVLSAAKVVRELRGLQYRQVKAGEAYEATLTYDKLLKAEKIHDDLVKHWTSEMSKPESSQIKMF